MRASDMISKHPHVEGHLNDPLAKAIEELFSWRRPPRPAPTLALARRTALRWLNASVSTSTARTPA